LKNLTFTHPISFLNAIGFCLLSFFLILFPAFLNQIFFKINFPIEFSIWLNIPAFLIPSLIILQKNNINLLSLFNNIKINSINFWLLSLYTSVGFILILGEIENYILYYFPISDDIYNLMESLLTSTSGIIAASLMAPITEEIFFRGTLLNGLNLKYLSTKAILLSSFLFGFIHLNPWQFIPAFFGGILFGYLYFISKNIWICIFLHFFNNSLAVFMELRDVNIKGVTYDPRIGIEFQPYWLTILGLIIFISGISLIYNKFHR